MSDERIEKLPKWAQDEFRNLQRDRDIAVRKLREYEDSQTTSGIYHENYLGLKDEKGKSLFRRRYINGTHQIEFEHKGVHLNVMLTEACPQHSDGIRLSWNLANDRVGEVAMIPDSFQCVRLVAQENMRNR